MRLGVFCGTFNPIHWGHLLVTEIARDQFSLDKVLFITSPTPPHRSKDLLDAESRYELVSAAVESNPHFEASRIELERSGPSFTIDTLEELKARHSQTPEFHLIIGQDNLGQISSWKRADDIFSLAKIIIAPRGVPDREAVLKAVPKNARVDIIDFPPVPVSGSLIRNRLRENKSVLYLVPGPVNKILLEKGHYK